MMQSSNHHYDTILAERYQWLTGCSFEEQTQRATDRFMDLRLRPVTTRRAVDLGAGTGAHAAALMECGYCPVVAIESNRQLFDGLRRRNVNGVQALLKDITDPVIDCAMADAELVICLGDTLAHLADQSAVDELLARIHAQLAPGGALVLSFRDYTSPLTGTDRFIPIRGDAGRSLTCMLEFGDTHVQVHDLFWEVDGERHVQVVGSYRKLRLDPLAVTCRLRELSYKIDRREAEGTMVTIVCRKGVPPSGGDRPSARQNSFRGGEPA